MQAGLSPDSIAWAFTSGAASNWHPLTWLSLMTDAELFGLDAGGYHLHSLAWHVLNTVLLLLLLVRMTGRLAASTLVAALFGLHPLHVESVAWVTERKDVLSIFFWLACTYAYVGWTTRKTAGRYALVVLLLALGLMAKPMLVTLPFTLLLLDLWPLGRVTGDAVSPWRTAGRRTWWALVREKLPLFALVAASSVVTFFVQRAAGAVRTLADYGVEERVANTLVGYATYLWRTPCDT